MSKFAIYNLTLTDIAEEGEDAFAAMRRAKQNKKIKGKKVLEVPMDDLAYGLEKVMLFQIEYHIVMGIFRHFLI